MLPDQSTKLPYKAARVVLLDPQGKEVCCGFHMVPQDGRGVENLAEVCWEAEKSCVAEFRKVFSVQPYLRGMAEDWSDGQTEAAINCLIALSGYKLDWFYSGWEEDDSSQLIAAVESLAERRLRELPNLSILRPAR